MPQYRNKPVVIEAEQVPTEDDKEAWGRVVTFLGTGGQWSVTEQKGVILRYVDTVSFYAGPGDWIIKDEHGNFLPCSPVMFEATYEAVEVTT